MSDVTVPRRDFLAAGVGLAAAAALAGQPGMAFAANDRINLGLIGCGVRGNYILGEALASGGGKVQVVGLCDVWKNAREETAARLAQKLPTSKPKLFARYEEMLAMPGLDAVIITTPDHAHCH